ncbi:MAG: Bro-N domain-containing protein [Candidatus Saccharimonadales bacterium]
MVNKSLPAPLEGESKIDIFQGQEVRKVYYNGEWWLVINDVIARLTDSKDPAGYIRDMRRRGDDEISKLLEPVEKGGGQFAAPLRLEIETLGGAQRMLCMNIEGIFRLVQSIPSKKAEPFKRWLAKVGFERIQEMENPDLAVKRAVVLYKAKGYSDEWIENRISNKASRMALTSAWKEYGMDKAHHIAVLTDAVSIKALGITTNDHKAFKGLVGQNLRDHMTPIEMTLMTLGEQATTQIVKARKPVGLAAHRVAATEGGGIAGNARKQIEEASGTSVISPINFLTDRQKLNNAKKLAERVKIDDRKPALPADKPLKIDMDMDKALQQIVQAPKPEKDAA